MENVLISTIYENDSISCFNLSIIDNNKPKVINNKRKSSLAINQSEVFIE